ncbi:hypothetical protein BCL93_101110 [Onishia taeanensis]|uniref:Uncharacterized protein n=1 Tax=Onishia taeanensis TaxID=284577 RepID=A0A328Y281_9GAMM|nr:hypothetical protein BCL93_101110 [Halomonas taeanensis]
MLWVISVKFTNFKEIEKEYKLPLRGSSIIDPSKAILVTEDNQKIWVGGMCYFWRYLTTQKRFVVIDSLMEDRISYVHEVISYFDNLVMYDSRKGISLSGLFRSCCKFITWCDESGHDEFHHSKENAKKAYVGFVRYLHEQVNTYKLKTGTAVPYQAAARDLLSYTMDYGDINSGVNELYTRNDSESREPPSEDRQSISLSVCDALFERISDFIMNKEDYPFHISFPKCIGLPEPDQWVFPSYSFFYKELDKYGSVADYRNSRFINRREGRLRTPEEYERAYGNASGIVKNNYHKALSALTKTNKKYFHHSRIQLARLATLSFATLFLANTGMNSAQVFNLKWSEDYELKKERYGFKAVKFRAGNRKVSFEIQNKFVKKFKKYIKMRKYLAEVVESDALILTGLKAQETMFPVTRAFEKLGVPASLVMPSEWRAAKSDWLISNSDISTTATLLQNTEYVVKNNYAAGSHTTHVDQMGAFLNYLSSSAIIISDRDEDISLGYIESAVGSCKSQGDPTKPNADTSIVPNCVQPEGCLFCENYAVHADDKDIRKLLSCLYMVELGKPLSGTIDDFDRMFGSVIHRIWELINHIKERSKEHQDMVLRIENEVFEKEELDPYWEHKAIMLIELGAV